MVIFLAVVAKEEEAGRRLMGHQGSLYDGKYCSGHIVQGN